MIAWPPQGDEELLQAGLAKLRELLPEDWRLTRENIGETGTPGAVVTLQSQDMATRLVIEAKRSFAPRDVEAVAAQVLPLVRSLAPGAAVMVIAQWLSPRTQALLTESGLGYVDLTGNAQLRIARPAVYIKTVGAQRDPQPTRRETFSLRGVTAGRVVRLLADVAPPYTATAVAQAAGASISYVSRLMSTLDRQALVRQDRRGGVVAVDWQNLLRQRAETYRLFDTNTAQGYLSPTGAREAVDRLRELPQLYQAVTGSFAAVARAPIAAPGQLVAYVDDPAGTADELGLLPAEQGADVVLLRPYDKVVLERLQAPGDLDGLKVAAMSQVALDCLAGNGRMPAEGEALLEWMTANESSWRQPNIHPVLS